MKTITEDQVYVCRKLAYTEERDHRYLMIWPDIPNWVVDEEALAFITAIEGEITFQKIKEMFQSAASTPDENVKDEVINNLINAKILYEKGDTSFQFLPGPDKIINVVVHPTNRCNLRCIMCSRNHILLGPGGDKGELTAEEVKIFLDQLP